MELFIETVEEYFETTFHKRTRVEKTKRKKRLKRLHRGTSFERMGKTPRKGFKRVKVGDKRYIWQRQTGVERVTKKKIGRQLGRKKSLRK